MGNDLSSTIGRTFRIHLTLLELKHPKDYTLN
jgi:hypothetical protein